MLFCVPALTILLAATSPQANQQIKIHEGEHWIWYCRDDIYAAHRADIEAWFQYADEAFRDLEDAWGLKPKQARYRLLVMDRTGGGFAGGVDAEGNSSPGIGVSYDAFYNVAHGIKAYWAPVLMTHEMVNLFTGEIVSGGWPRDWWADDRSPFPYVTSVEIEYKLVPQVGALHFEEGRKDPQILMFTALKDEFGWRMFRRAFQTAIDDGISWDKFGGNPSALRTNYVAAYLELGAGENLSRYMNGPVPAYDHRMVASILAARKRWQSHAKGSDAYDKDRELYLGGMYNDVQ